MTKSTFEPQYLSAFQLLESVGRLSLPVMANQTLLEDPKRFGFMLSRYKFASKNLEGFSKVLEVGCGDGFGARLLSSACQDYTGIDADPMLIAEANKFVKMPSDDNMVFRVDNFAGEEILIDKYDAVVSLDVLEHIPEIQEHQFLVNVTKALHDSGVFICGMPSLESQCYASPRSKAGHVNCKSGNDLKTCLSRYFNNVFQFSMNDEVVHTGFYPMAHYLIAICVGPKLFS